MVTHLDLTSNYKTIKNEKLSITLILCLSTLFNLFAQEGVKEDSKKVTFGIKAGGNLSTPSGYITEDTKSKFNYHIGAFAEFKLSEKFAIQPELQYSVQGAELNSEISLPNSAPSEFIISDTYNYLNFAVKGKYFLTEKLSLEAGPQIGYLLSAKRNFEASPFSPDFTDDARKIDFGVNFGVGYKISKHFSFGARYNLGLSKVANSPGTNLSGFGKLKNRVFQASIGYSF